MRRCRLAFTLLEMVIVLLVIGLTAAIAAPRFSQTMRGVHSRAVAIQIAAHTEYVRRTAINQGRSTTLTFHSTGDGYSSPDVDFPDRVGQTIIVNIHEFFDPSVSVSADFDAVAQSNSQTITFDLEGVPRVGSSAMQTGLITISSPGTPVQFVRIAPGTGTVSVESESESASGGNT